MASDATNEVNNSIMTPTAADKVFNTTELLETILLSLDFRTLRRRSINSTFSATIATSPHLQTALSLRPPAHNTTTIYTNILWSKISTPEAYNFCLAEHAASGDVVFHFGNKTPSAAEPATGSWRGMYFGVRMTPGRSEIGVRWNGGRHARYIAAWKEPCTLGEALDASVGVGVMGGRWR
ncbi:hypothetical protein M409DRAFT_26858 [Zasmidium cellare ATCC 36951]|uniref:Uncharacterized protein n=1 Tax=Zasmidium cellare ATCC 36951 TaxID=1080233 RepID=A0A6A6CAY9_ZASCE|nr:uncharacterized protein M409DRAFT_26858 [Zasmidium cellare ATCC 36951]KAF2162616.1 hypothetical protein M409DRAFT_26858 [Zasmidium cellare ATCC 36951]